MDIFHLANIDSTVPPFTFVFKYAKLCGVLALSNAVLIIVVAYEFESLSQF
jgi:hypothetical protein